MGSAILSIFTGLLIAVCSSWVTVRLSLRKFQKEKLWEHKLDAYKKIIASLHSFKRHLSYEIGLLTGENDHNHISDKENIRLFKRYRTEQDEMLKYEAMGSLIISEEAINLLKQFHIDVNKRHEHYYDYLSAAFDAADVCMQSLIKVAKKDLKCKNKMSILG